MSINSPDVRLLERFGAIRRMLNQVAIQELKSQGLSPQQALILRYVSRNPACSQATLSRATASDPAAVCRALDGLVASDWLERREDPADRRRWVLALTGSAARKVRAVEAAYARIARIFAGALSQAERRTLAGLLEKIELRLGEEGEGHERE